MEQSYIHSLCAAGLLEIVQPVHLMQKMDVHLSKEQLALLAKQGNKLNKHDKESFIFVNDTCFDHGVPDGHSFPESLRPLLLLDDTKPYRKTGTSYYEEEEKDFIRYKQGIIGETEPAMDKLSENGQGESIKLIL